MDKTTEVALKQIELINQEIIKLSTRVAKLETQILKQEVRITPKIINPQINRIISEADKAMDKLNRRINNEG